MSYSGVIKTSEAEIYNILKDNCPGMEDLRMVLDNPYSDYDAYTDDYIIEFKTRHKDYSSTLLEKSKCVRNMIEAKKQNKKFIYCVSDPKGVFCFSIDKLVKDKFKFDWIIIGCPKTSYFENNNKIDKLVANIPFELSQWKYLWPEIEETEDPISLFKQR